MHGGTVINNIGNFRDKGCEKCNFKECDSHFPTGECDLLSGYSYSTDCKTSLSDSASGGIIAAFIIVPLLCCCCCLLLVVAAVLVVVAIIALVVRKNKRSKYEYLGAGEAQLYGAT